MPKLNKKLDEAEDAKFREPPKRGPLYGARSDAIFVDEFLGRKKGEVTE